MKKELKIKEASRALGVTLDYVYRLIYAGRLEARKSDGRWLIPAKSIESRLQAREVSNGTSRL